MCIVDVKAGSWVLSSFRSLKSHDYFDSGLTKYTAISTGYLMRYTKETTSAMDKGETMCILTTFSNKEPRPRTLAVIS